MEKSRLEVTRWLFLGSSGRGVDHFFSVGTVLCTGRQLSTHTNSKEIRQLCLYVCVNAQGLCVYVCKHLRTKLG